MVIALVVAVFIVIGLVLRATSAMAIASIAWQHIKAADRKRAGLGMLAMCLPVVAMFALGIAQPWGPGSLRDAFIGLMAIVAVAGILLAMFVVVFALGHARKPRQRAGNSGR